MYYLKKLYNLLETIPLDNISYKYELINKGSISVKNPFISSILIKRIKLLKQHMVLYTTINKVKYTIHIYHNEDSIIKFINYILITIKFITYFYTKDNTITINYYLLDDTKTINNKSIFTGNEVNSGMTNLSTNTIDIWRKEEIMKVTLHELIHALKLDFTYYDLNNNLVNLYNDRYRLKIKGVMINEAYTDFWAIIFNSYLICIIKNASFYEFNNLIKKDIKFINYQSNKILSISSGNINKYTNVFSYYILKNELFHSLHIILQYCYENNLQFILINDLTQFINLLINLRKPSTYKINKKDKWYKTMRMSINSIDIFKS